MTGIRDDIDIDHIRENIVTTDTIDLILEIDLIAKIDAVRGESAMSTAPNEGDLPLETSLETTTDPIGVDHGARVLATLETRGIDNATITRTSHPEYIDIIPTTKRIGELTAIDGLIRMGRVAADIARAITLEIPLPMRQKNVRVN